MVLGLLTMVVYQSCTQEDLYIDEQVQTKIEHPTTPPPPDGGVEGDADGWSYYCSFNQPYVGVHSVQKNDYSYNYRCKIQGENSIHWTSIYSTAADYHCQTGS